MYHYQRAIGKAMDLAGRWQDIDIAAMALRVVYAQYRKVYAVLTNDFNNYEVSLDLDKIKIQVAGTDMTIDDFLIANGNKTLPVEKRVPEIATTEVIYGPPVQVGYKAYLTDGFSGIDNENMSTKKWLYLKHDKRKEKDPDYFKKAYEGSLIEVNGFVHRTDFDSNGLYVIDAVKSRDVCGTNNMGMLSFSDVGKLTFIPIKKSMIHKREENQVYRNAIDINLGKDINNKSIIMVLGGYMHILDRELFWPTGDKSVRINFKKFNWLERYFESIRFLDLSELGLTEDGNTPDVVRYDELFSDETIIKYLTMNNSFFALVDNPDMYVETEKLWSTRASGTYNTVTFPCYPMIIGRGRMGSYWYEKDYEGYSVWHAHGHMDNLLDQTRVLEYGKNQVVTGQRQVSWPSVSSGDYRTEAWFKRIKSDKINWKKTA